MVRLCFRTDRIYYTAIQKEEQYNTNQKAVVVSLNASMKPTHVEEKNPEELMQLFTIDENLCNPQRDQIVIVDDVLRYGVHFKAIKTLLQPRFSDSEIIGLYILLAQFIKSAILLHNITSGAII